jgi:adenosylhomocysteine nucleosidase
MIAIIAAMDIEARSLIKSMSDVKEEKISSYQYIYQGHLGTKDLIVAICGVGKVNAATITTYLLSHYQIDLIVSTGLCGTCNSELEVGTIIIGERVCQFDIDTTVFQDPPGLVSGLNKVYFASDKKISKSLVKLAIDHKYPYYFASIGSSDSFISGIENTLKINELFSCDCFEMEAGAIAQVGAIFNKPVGIIKIVSDVVSENNASEYELNKTKINTKLTAFLSDFVLADK